MTDKLFVDMETRSSVDLKKCGVYVYAESPNTDIFCIALNMVQGMWGSYGLWVNPKFQHLLVGVDHRIPLVNDPADLMTWLQTADEIHAHNAQFERVMWTHIMHMRYGFDQIPMHKWRCTAAKAAAMALPRSLGGVGDALDLDVQTDKEGHRLMMRLCKPDKDNKWPSCTPEQFVKLCKYCIQDVASEIAVDEALPDLSPKELEVWRLDQLINDRGIMVAGDDIQNFIWKINDKKVELKAEIPGLVGDAFDTIGQRDKVITWLADQGVEVDQLTKETVTEVLEEDVPDAVRRVLEIRQSLAKTSVTKLGAMRRRACKDGRVRGAFLYHAASPGRWGGVGVQPHNMVRATYDEEMIERLLHADRKGAEALAQMCVIQAASKCLRGMLVASPGKKFMAADFSSIEARGLAWLAGEKKVLDDFTSGRDPYIVAAQDVYQVPYDEITSDQRFKGKTTVLACGYQGWLAAYRKMLGDKNDQMTDEEIIDIIKRWRQSRPATVQLWKSLENAAMHTVRTGETTHVGRVTFLIKGSFLLCRLPSGRYNAYYRPKIRQNMVHDKPKDCVSYMGNEGYKWRVQFTYGGKLTENVDQGMCRDILVDAMFRVEESGLGVIMHVHDEIIVEISDEVAENPRTLPYFEQLVAVVPEWAAGMPIEAEGWIGQRYRKG